MSRGTANTYKLWAIVTSGLCVALGAYIVASYVTAPVDEAPMADDAALVAELAVPAEFHDLPQEWMSAALDEGSTGHSIMIEFAPAGEFIAERCTHRG